MASTEIHTIDQQVFRNGGGSTVAPPAGTLAARISSRLSVMLVMVVVAAGVAVATLGILIAWSEPTAAIAAAVVLLSVTVAMAGILFAERRRLRREAANAAVVHPPVGPTVRSMPGNGSELIAELPPADAATKSARAQADLLEEVLHWSAKGA